MVHKMHEVRVCSLVPDGALTGELRNAGMRLQRMVGSLDTWCVYLDECPEDAYSIEQAIGDDQIVTTWRFCDQYTAIAQPDGLQVVTYEYGGCSKDDDTFAVITCLPNGRSLRPFASRLGLKVEQRYVAFSDVGPVLTVEYRPNNQRPGGQVWEHSVVGMVGDGFGEVVLTQQRLMRLGSRDDLSAPYRGAIRAAQMRYACRGCFQPHFAAGTKRR